MYIGKYQKKNTRLELAQRSLKRWKAKRSKTLKAPRFIEKDETCKNCFKVLNEKIKLIEDKTFKSISCPVCGRAEVIPDEYLYSKYRQRKMQKFESDLKKGRNLSVYPINDNRLELIEKLGNSKCKRCGFDDIRALQLDHVKGDGVNDRKRFKNIQYMWLYYNEHPKIARKKLQVLCANCNWIKRSEKNESSWHFKRKQGKLEAHKTLKKWKEGFEKFKKKQKRLEQF